MISYSRNLVLLAAAAVVLPAAAARAQSYGPSYAQPAPFYPYAVQQSQPYAIQVAPNTYVIQRPAQMRDFPYVNCINCSKRAAVRASKRAAPRFDRPHKPADRVLVEELRKRSHSKSAVAGVKRKDVVDTAEKDVVIKSTKNRTVVNTTKFVHEPPVVRVHKRYVDDPPRVIERHTIVDEPARAKCKRGLLEHCDRGNRTRADETKKRVIDAEAEITILGPDRMNIRLFRKRGGPDAKALTDE